MTEGLHASATVGVLLTQLETEARANSWRLEQAGRLPCGFTHTHYPLTPAEETENRRQLSCWYLAADHDTLRALLAGERVPAGKLRPGYLDLHRERTE